MTAKVVPSKHTARTPMAPPPNLDELPYSARVSAYAVAKHRGISEPTVWRWTRKGLLPQPERVGGTTRWIAGEIRSRKSEV